MLIVCTENDAEATDPGGRPTPPPAPEEPEEEDEERRTYVMTVSATSPAQAWRYFKENLHEYRSADEEILSDIITPLHPVEQWLQDGAWRYAQDAEIAFRAHRRDTLEDGEAFDAEGVAEEVADTVGRALAIDLRGWLLEEEPGRSPLGPDPRALLARIADFLANGEGTPHAVKARWFDEIMAAMDAAGYYAMTGGPNDPGPDDDDED
jgi:hypothetical protein